jgi:hypothetical protein
MKKDESYEMIDLLLINIRINTYLKLINDVLENRL